MYRSACDESAIFHIPLLTPSELIDQNLFKLLYPCVIQLITNRVMKLIGILCQVKILSAPGVGEPDEFVVVSNDPMAVTAAVEVFSMEIVPMEIA